MNHSHTNVSKGTFMIKLTILCITIVLVTLCLSLIYRYLITTNKIKPSKISKLFYEDDYTKSWEEIKEKGMLKYILKNIITTTVMMGIVGIYLLLNKLNLYGYKQSQTLLVVLSMGVILGLINSLTLYLGGEHRYEQLKEKEKMESKNINSTNKKY